MENKNNRVDSKVNDLITIDDKLKEYLGYLDDKNPVCRQLVISAIEGYIKQYVTPALYLLPNINLDDVFGERISGLALDVVFDSKKTNLDRPSDRELDYVFKEVIGLKPSPDLRQRFWDAWLVRESFHCIMRLCNFLKKSLIPPERKSINPDTLTKEIEQLQYILTLEMTPGFAQWIESTLGWEKKALAEWNKQKNIS